jgi:cysteine desulfuration protein SufE
MSPVDKIQEEIVREFALLDGDPEMTVLYIMELGMKLPAYPEQYRTDDYLVKGCQSKVWMHAHRESDRILFDVDSNTAITKGLASLLVRIYSGQSAGAILESDLTFMSAIHMDRYIGTQRSNGFAAMVRQMKYYALALKANAPVNP